jgi:lysophospholipase L1-like esterase
MMHLGTNDVWSNQSPAQILAAYGTMVDWMRQSNPKMRILVRVLSTPPLFGMFYREFFNISHTIATPECLLTLDDRLLRSYP